MSNLSQIKGLSRLERGGIIDRCTKISFKVDGVSLEGFAGDTLASAMLAQGRIVMGRSFKYHRPRGVMTAGSEEPNALFDYARVRDANQTLRRPPSSCSTGLTRALKIGGRPSILIYFV